MALSVWALLLLVAGACATSPSGRTQILLNSEIEMAEMGRLAFVDMQTSTPRSTDARRIRYVRCVAGAITETLTADELRPIFVKRWEVELFEDPTANAFALPGGKMGVHTGLLVVATTPSQLAAVLGHEVGHVLSRHGNERVSQEMLAQGGLQALQVMIADESREKQGLYGALGASVVRYGVLMPYGRLHESEADSIGLMLMARAGFDPRESVTLWRNMARASSGQSPPEFLSTHPSSETRIGRLQAEMSGAVLVYEEARAVGHRPNCR
jgi:predicted Zn-dependent protease